ncbi:protein pellino-like [Anabrus simplex]|uniref:protein pellino-like n=1 Tax=Anabrus simplex TaxID=316456 RepID=UPI0035A2DA16
MIGGKKLRKKCFSDVSSHCSHASKSDGSEMPILKEQNSNCAASEKVKYGELVVLGYNGFLPEVDRWCRRRRSKFVLYKRDSASGIKPSRHRAVPSSLASKAIMGTKRFSISYSSPKDQATVVEYVPDDNTDMFQIGRSANSAIDCVVLDVFPGNLNVGKESVKSTVSRFACRLIADRTSPHIVRIYAAGFDSSRNIFVGEEATTWQNENTEIDGLTTNGVLIWHPQGTFLGGEIKPGWWREVSIGGKIYSLRPSRCAREKGKMIKDESNILQDGTLIDICGATLLWRSDEGLKKSPTKSDLEELVDELNSGKPVCPVGLNTLVIPRKVTPDMNEDVSEKQQPYVYLNCGHVQGSHNWGERTNSERCCPVCWTMGPVVKLCMGMEPAFYVDSGPLTFAFNPCGHMASEKTVKYWVNMTIPHGTNDFKVLCPFCVTPLAGSTGYVRLIYQDHVD